MDTMIYRFDKTGSLEYDWVSGGHGRTPEEYPYSFDAHFIWKSAGVDEDSAIYSDRMWQWDRKKAKIAFQDRQAARRLGRKEAEAIIDRYYDGKYECVGYAYGCNQSNGYPYGIFFIREKQK
ncbi:hypothetical protein [Roseibium sp.]|uniref:hypothetical protein n=1 Tax=Roseibium sp. TaxID=1936156 RepID=UPI003B517BD8